MSTGIYIKGMEMPKNCWRCEMPLRGLKCPAQTKEEAMHYCSCRHKDCPLTPHGKLGIIARVDTKTSLSLLSSRIGGCAIWIQVEQKKLAEEAE